MVFFISTMNVHFKNESCKNERKNTPYDRGTAGSSRRKQGARRGVEGGGGMEGVGSTTSVVESRSRATPREPAAGTLTGGVGEGKTSPRPKPYGF